MQRKTADPTTGPWPNHRQRRLVVDALLLGVVGALSAQLFMLLLHWANLILLTGIAGYHPPGLPEEGGVLREQVGPYGLWLIPLVTTLGGLVSGVLVYWLAPEAEGHGTDTAVKAFHFAGGRLRYRIPLLKMIASAITIGSGGAAGREGPIALISAGVGSAYADLGRRTEEERRILVLVGMAAGLSAIFRSPLGAAVFAIEVLYWDMEFEVRALLYALLAAVVAYTVNGPFVGWEPLFRVPGDLTVTSWDEYGWYAVLGVAAGIVGTLLPVVFYGVRDAFRALPIPPHFKPAIGGLGIGLLALLLPQVLGGGYGWIQEAIDGKLATQLLIALLFAKIAAFSLTVSSGGSGGVFAPSLFVGAMLGGSLAQVIGLSPTGFVIVGMAAVFSGAARVPIATLLMVAEMTGGYSLLVPASLAVVVSCLVQTGLSSRLRGTRLDFSSLYEAQVERRSDSPAHRAEHVQIAMQLLRDAKVPDGATLGHLDLVTLLRGGIPIDLPNHEQLYIGVLRNDSACVGQPIRSNCLVNAVDAAELVGVLRGGEMLLAHSGQPLEAGDQVLLIGTAGAWSQLGEHLTNMTETTNDGERAV